MSEEKKSNDVIKVQLVKKPWYKRWWGIAIIALGVLIVISSITNQGEKPSNSASQSEAVSNTASSESADTTKDNIVKIGESLQIGEVKWIATNPVKEAQISPSSQYSQPAKANGVFIVVDLTAELTGKDGGTIDGSQFKITDSKGRTFDATSDINVNMAIGSDNMIFLKQVNPNVPVKGKTVFDVAADATGLKLQINDLRFGSDEKGFVDLGI